MAEKKIENEENFKSSRP